MSLDVFSEPWASAFGEALNQSEAYREAATTWEGPLVLAMGGKDDVPDRAVFLDLWHGTCRDARVATAEDLEAADFVIHTDRDTWRKVLAGGLEPIWGLMSGQLKLTRGSIASLVPYGAASKQLVASAAGLDNHFPD